MGTNHQFNDVTVPVRWCTVGVCAPEALSSYRLGLLLHQIKVVKGSTCDMYDRLVELLESAISQLMLITPGTSLTIVKSRLYWFDMMLQQDIM